MIFVVMNNRSHGTISDLQAANFGAQLRLRLHRPGRRAVQPRLRRLRPGLRRRRLHRRQRRPTSATALRAAIAARRPAVLDVPMVNEPVPTPGHWNIKDIYHGVFE